MVEKLFIVRTPGLEVETTGATATRFTLVCLVSACPVFIHRQCLWWELQKRKRGGKGKKRKKRKKGKEMKRKRKGTKRKEKGYNVS
jgi:hypothetical protein